MSSTAEKTDPKLWEEVKKDVTKSNKGGKPGQWSARKAQMAVQEYKEEGGGYKGKKSADNHLKQWQDEDWGTKSGKKSLESGERYLPKKSRAKLSDAEYRRTSDKKRADMKKGVQHSAQPKDVAKKTATGRGTGKSAKSSSKSASARGGETKAALMERARAKGIEGRSRMSKGELERALHA